MDVVDIHTEVVVCIDQLLLMSTASEKRQGWNAYTGNKGLSTDNDNNNNNNKNKNKNNNNKNAFQLMMSQVRAGQVLSLQSSLSCASL